MSGEGISPKVCQLCGEVLQRRAKEIDVQWFKRKFCSWDHAKAARETWGRRATRALGIGERVGGGWE